MIIRGQEVEFPWSQLQSLIETRLRGGRTILPGISHDEEPADIFVDIAERHPASRAPMRIAVANLLSDWVYLDAADSARVRSLGELCYLAARIGCTEALESLRILVSNERATGLVTPGEDLRLRALRALVGLLGSIDGVRRADYESTLRNALAEPRLRLPALIGLIGISPENEATLLAEFASQIDSEELLRLGIRLTFGPTGL